MFPSILRHTCSKSIPWGTDLTKDYQVFANARPIQTTAIQQPYKTSHEKNCWEIFFSTHLRIQRFPQRSGSSLELPSGYLTVRHGKIHPFLSSVNHLFLWVIYTMVMLVITRWYMSYTWPFQRSFSQTPWPQTRRGQSGRPPTAAASTPGPPRCRMGC